MFSAPAPAPNTPTGAFLISAIQRMLVHPFLGAAVNHFQAQLAGAANFNDENKPDYLAGAPGDYATGVVFVANPANPLKGVVCRAPWRPQQDVGGIHMTAQFELYLPQDIGDVFILDGTYPKRQDKFVISGVTYYAIAPAQPCMVGDTIALWKIELSLQRYPVPNGQIVRPN